MGFQKPRVRANARILRAGKPWSLQPEAGGLKRLQSCPATVCSNKFRGIGELSHTLQGLERTAGWTEASAAPQCDLKGTASLFFSFIPCRRKDVGDTGVFTLPRVIDPFGDMKTVNFLDGEKIIHLV